MQQTRICKYKLRLVMHMLIYKHTADKHLQRVDRSARKEGASSPPPLFLIYLYTLCVITAGLLLALPLKSYL